MPAIKYPARLRDASGRIYWLKTPPRTLRGQTYPAVYTRGAKEYFPDLAFVVALERGDTQAPPPVMLGFQ